MLFHKAPPEGRGKNASDGVAVNRTNTANLCRSETSLGNPVSRQSALGLRDVEAGRETRPDDITMAGKTN